MTKTTRRNFRGTFGIKGRQEKMWATAEGNRRPGHPEDEEG